MDADAILAAIRGVLLGELGTVRTIPAGTFLDGVPASLVDDASRAGRALTKPCFDIELDPALATSAVGPRDASRALLSMPVKITLTYPITDVNDAENGTERRRIRALAAEQANMVTQALEWGRNVEEDGDGTPTGIIPGGLRAVSRPIVRREDWTAGLYEIELRFEAYVLETRAVA